jgi:hypothetical protein
MPLYRDDKWSDFLTEREDRLREAHLHPAVMTHGERRQEVVKAHRAELAALPLKQYPELPCLCHVKGCAFPAVHCLEDINEVVPVCSIHGEFYHEEAGYFDLNIRRSFLEHTSSTHSSLGEVLQTGLHPNVGRKIFYPKVGRIDISHWAIRAAEKRERERIRDRIIIMREALRESRIHNVLIRRQELIAKLRRLGDDIEFYDGRLRRRVRGDGEKPTLCNCGCGFLARTGWQLIKGHGLAGGRGGG